MSGRVRHRTPVVVAGKAYAKAPRKPQPRYPVDWALVAELDAAGIDRRTTRPKANGSCHECGRKIPPLRHLCGRCYALDPRGVHRGEGAPDRDPHMWPAGAGDVLRVALGIAEDTLEAERDRGRRLDTLIADVIVPDLPPVVDWTGDVS